MLIISVYLVIGPIVDNPKIEYLYATVFILAGFVVYVPFVYYQKVLPGMSKLLLHSLTFQLRHHVYWNFDCFSGHVTTFFQLLLEVAPSTSVAED